MQYRAGQVENGPQIGLAGLFGTAADGAEQGRFFGQRQTVFDALAGGGQFGANAAGNELTAMYFNQCGNLG